MSLGTVHDYGDQALLLEFDSTAEVLAWADALREADLLGVLDIVPASRTVLLKLASPRYREATRQRLGKLRVEGLDVDSSTAPQGQRADVVIDVVYDGEDLDEVARLAGTDRGRGGRRPHRESDAGRIRRIRTGFRLSGRRGPPTERAPARRPTHAGSGRLGGTRRRVQWGLPPGVARRLAADRPHRRGAVGHRTRSTRSVDTRHVGPVPGDRGKP